MSAQAELRREPRVELVHPGVWSVPVPIPNNPLGYTLVYAFETPRGPVLVDAGWNTDRSWTALAEGLNQAGMDVGSCYGVLVTHFHPDHHGLAGRVRDASGAWLAIHPQDAMVITHWPTPDEWLMQSVMILLDAGASEDDLAALPNAGSPGLRPPATPDRLLADGERVDVPGRDVVAIWTPGHTPGHCCLYDRDARLLLTGDHVLPKISPHIGLYDEDEPSSDPLGSFIDSLRKVAPYDVDVVLPAHEYRFTDLAGRVEALIEHHRERLDAVLTRLREGPASVWEIALVLPWNRPWDEIKGLMRRAAIHETLAHVRALEHEGAVERVAGMKPATFRLTRQG